LDNKVEVDGVQYTVCAVPPYIYPYLDLYTKLVRKIEETITLTDAEEIAKQLEVAVTRLLEATVDPKPQKGHEGALLVAVTRYNNEFNTEYLQPFRARGGPKSSINKEGRRSQPISPSTPK